MTLRRPLVLGSILLVGLVPLYAQPGGGASDTVKYRDRTKDNAEVTKIGEVKETAAGIVVTVSGSKPVAISPADVIAVYYGTLAGVDDRTRQELPALDLKGGPEARAKYTALLADVSAKGTSNERSKRFLEFKQAMWHAKIADSKSGDEFRAEANAAVNNLLTVARSYSKSWEVWPASRTAARLQAELGKFNDASQTLATLAKTEGLSVELQNEAKLAEVDVLFRGGNPITADPVIQAVAKVSTLTNAQKSDSQSTKLRLKGAQEKTDEAKVKAAAKVVNEQIDKMTDPASRAAAHNVLGELYLMANLPRDAMWEFLWVEIEQVADRDDVAESLERLADLFEKQGEKERAAVYREKLIKAKGA